MRAARLLLAPPSWRPLVPSLLALAWLVAAAGVSRAQGSEDEREPPPQRVSLERLEGLARGTVDQAPLGPAPAATTTLSPGGLQWTFLGPRPMTGDFWSGNGNVGGRVSCVATHPTDSAIAYLAAAQGGVWKTIDGGDNWVPLTDGLSSLASGWVTLDPGNPSVLWYGTGEQHYSGDSFYGDGLFKSVDAGLSWIKVATSGTVGSYIARVVLKPGTTNTIYVGSSNGFMRSVDSGVNWTQTLGGGWVDDVAVNAAHPAVVYATVNGAGIFRSDDSGATWTPLGVGLPTSGFDRINFAIAPSNDAVLYAGFVNPSGGLLGMYKTVDAGTTWAPLPATPNYLGGQGWYDHTIAVSPTNPNICFAAGVYPYGAGYFGIIRTLDGGLSWTDVTKPADGVWVHPDVHTLAFGPGGALWVGCDGGVWKTTDLGAHWKNRNATLGAAQLYTVTLHPTNPTEMLGGTQDNGSLRYQGVVSWGEVISGDGGPNVYEAASPNIFYTSYVQLTGMYRWNNGAYLGDVTGPWEGSDPADWCNGPFLEDPNSSGTLLVGTNRVWRSVNHGASWSTLSGTLTNQVLLAIAVGQGAPNTIMTGGSDGAIYWTDDAATWVPRSAGLTAPIPDLWMDPFDPAHAVLCAGSSAGARVLETTNSGTSWTDRTGTLPIGARPLSLAVDFRTTPARLYLGTDHGVWASLDGGANWVRSSTALPSVAVYDVQLDTVNDVLVAATHGRGAWRSPVDVAGPTLELTTPNGGEGWAQGLTRSILWSADDASDVGSIALRLSTDGGATYPTILATDLPNSGRFDWLVAGGPTATARVQLIAADGLGNVSEIASASDFAITSPPLSVGSPLPTVASLRPVAPNPGRAPFDLRFDLPGDGVAQLDVLDVNGRRVRSLASGPFTPGSHALRWDGRDAAGSLVGNGVYFVRLRATGREQTRSVAVIR